MRRILASIVVMAASVTLLGQSEKQAQPPVADVPIQGPTFRTGVDVVSIDVAVMDSRGRPVLDLRAPEFVVKVDGKARRVVTAQPMRIDVEAEKRRAAEPQEETLFTTNITPTNGRAILIAVDQTHIRPGAARPILNTAAKFLDQLSPTDQVAFVAFPPPGPSIGFTRDRLRIRQAMNQVVGVQQQYEGRYNMGISEAIAIHDNRDESVFESVSTRECSGLRPGERQSCEDEVEAEAEERVAYTRRETYASLNSLEALLRDMAILDGQKSLILLSESLIVEAGDAQLEDLIRVAAVGRVSVNVLLMDVPGMDVTQGLLPPSPIQDRHLEESGLESLAVLSRGALFKVIGSGERIFERLASELSAYYLLGVEQQPGDNDGKRHRVEVEVRRKGLTLRSRSAFVVSTATSVKPEDRLMTALRSPFGVAEIPMRVTNFTYQDPDSDKVQIFLAAEVGQAGAPAAEYTVGFVVIDDQGRVVVGGDEKRKLMPIDGRENVPLGYAARLLVEPGKYSLRLAAVDAEGRRGSVVRDLSAWKTAGEEFAVGDLMVGAPPPENRPMEPQVEPQVHEGVLAAYVELYASSPAAFDDAVVAMELADDVDGPPLATITTHELAGSRPTTRGAQAVFSVGNLPSGRYVVRAQITRGGKPAGMLVRPLVLAASTTRAALPLQLGSVVPAFDRAAVLQADVVASMLDFAQRASPALGDAMVEARAGRYGAAALEALGAGDQPAAAFLRGLDLFIKGQLDEAHTQLNIASGPRREFFPAAFYLGAIYAAAGRDQDAAGVWQNAIAGAVRPPLAYTLFADARLRAGQPESAVDVLRPAREQLPQNDDIAKRLALAYLMTAQYGDALPVLRDYLTRHPADQDALFSIVLAQYEVTSRGGAQLSTADYAALTKYLKAYKGPQQALLAKYLAAIAPR